MSPKAQDAIRLIVSIAVCESAGAIGGIATASSVGTWYAELEKPGFTPPSWVFSPVWITLYALMGIAAWLVWRKGLERHDVRVALIFFIIQLVLNMLWSLIFFGAQAPLLALIDLVLLWVTLLITTVLFWRISVLAGILLLPYAIWTSFAGVLNYRIWRLN